MKRKMVICHLVLSLEPGGTEHLVYRMCLDLRRDHEVMVCCLDSLGHWGERLREEGVPVYVLFRSPGVDLSLPFALARILRAHQVDVLHAHQYSPFFYGALTKLLAPGIRVVFLEHGRHWPEKESLLKNIFNRFVLQPLADQIVAVSRETKDRLVRYEGLSPARIRVIYNGIQEVSVISPQERVALRQELGFYPGDRVLVTVGRFDPIKNLPLLLEALALSRSAGSPLKGLLIGDGPMMAEIKALKERLGLGGSVVLTGYRSDATRLLQVADMFVLSSFSEGTSLALLEAMAAGLPCVVTDVGGNPEIVVDGKTGLVVPSADVVKMAAALSLLAEREDIARKMGQAAQERFRRHFTFGAMMEKYRALYQGLGA
ncbi:glycosyltransferase [Thermosulfuriphilus ammonigenes]|uniref:Glycosyltransferase n=1 Tax=Thermosulfuriphilus ammonigenes TaxID=1936021 RepID=A0A6G7PYF9_9BACT|nr:glycosyltransferase [Thermosulfuriphilus ammonigenes]MBA2849521.1 glycosyltransferase involved in cell wall biosynthesis [Thermosulfuriphilus ammonigenes]QIJ72586.1 glycosyltransferase [Thermosulfuriphilus ammonigenes]